MTTSVRLSGVSKHFGTKKAVRQLDLEIEKGECYAFLGPNGAGKTTTIKMLTSLLRPTAGKIEVAGFDISKEGHEVRKRICYIPDQPYMYDRLSGREFLQFIGSLRGMKRDEVRRKIAELSEQFGAASYLDEPANSYSHGMKQRVVVIAGLIPDPEVIFLDEPMVGLDPRLIRRFKDILSERTKQGATVFMSTHNLADAEEMAHRIGIIHEGKLVTEGTLADIREKQGMGRLEEVFLRLTENVREG